MSRLIYYVTIPQWENSIEFSKKAKPKYWEWKDKEKLPKKFATILGTSPLISSNKAYCVSLDGELFLKNPTKAGMPNKWILNGQALYNAVLDWRKRKKVAEYYHAYFSTYIKAQLPDSIIIPAERFLSISCDIYEIPRGQMPDVSNMWLLEKFFEDALQECGVIPDDSPKYVIESGRKRYHWVSTEAERKLVFNIEVVQ